MKRTLTVIAFTCALSNPSFSQTSRNAEQKPFEWTSNNENFGNSFSKINVDSKDYVAYINWAIAASAFFCFLFFYTSRRHSILQASITGFPGVFENRPFRIILESPGRKSSMLFEEYIAGLFDPSKFIIKKWMIEKTGLKNPVLSNQCPELELAFLNKGYQHPFAIHCIWSDSYQNDHSEGLQILTDSQLKNYLKYQRKENLPVWIVLGMGGNPSRPDNIYLLRASDLKEGFVSEQDLDLYRVKKLTQRFSYNPNTKRVINE